MSFETIDSVNKRKALINKYLKNREILKKRQLDEKIDKQSFQREVATELQKPVVEQAKKVAEKAQEKTDELQNALIQQLQDNQAQIVGQLGLDRNALVNALQALPAAQQPPALPVPQATASPITADVDVGIDSGVLQKLNLPPPSHFLRQSKKATVDTRKSLSTSHIFRSLSAKQNRTPEEKNTLSALQQYIDSLKAIEAGFKSGQLQQPPKQQINIQKRPTTGQGMPSTQTKNPYKLTADSMFGNLWIDPDKLNELKLEAFKEGKKVLSRKVDFDLLELLTKRFNTKKDYSQKALDTFSKLIELSGVPINARSLKFQITKGTGVKKPKHKAVEIKYYSSPDELVERLRMIIGHKKGGGSSLELDNEMVEILNKLLQDGVITNAQYKNIYNNYI